MDEFFESYGEDLEKNYSLFKEEIGICFFGPGNDYSKFSFKNILEFKTFGLKKLEQSNAPLNSE